VARLYNFFASEFSRCTGYASGRRDTSGSKAMWFLGVPPEQMRGLVRPDDVGALVGAMPAGHEICVPKSPACWWAHPPRACPDAPADHGPPIIKRPVATWSRDDDASADAGSPLVYGCQSRGPVMIIMMIYIYIYMQSKVWCVERVL
jgi:hypothetical protein